MFTAAHNPEGKASLVIELAGAGEWEVVTSAYCLAEARRNLERKHTAATGRLPGNAFSHGGSAPFRPIHEQAEGYDGDRRTGRRGFPLGYLSSPSAEAVAAVPPLLALTP
jgi:hypothetical protein